MFLVLTSLERILAPCCSCGRASDGHESASPRLAWPSVATRNGLAPARTNRRAQDVRLFGRRLLSVGRFATYSHGGSDAPRLVCIEISQQPVPQVNLMPNFRHLHQSDRLTAKGFADKAQAPLPSDFTVASDSSQRPMLLIGPSRLSSSIQALGTPIQTLGHYLSQGLMRPLPVELLHPSIKPRLLGSCAVRCRLRRFRFQRAMHSFVLTILLRLTWRDILHSNTQPQPPHAQSRQPTGSRRTKRRSVIHPDDLRSAILLEPQLKLAAHLLMRRSSHHLATQYVTAKQIAGRQGIAAPPIARPKPTLEIHRPHVIGLHRFRQLRPGLHRPSPPPPPRSHQPFSHQDSTKRARRWQPFQSVTCCQFAPQFLRTPMRMTHSQTHHSPHPLLRTLMRTKMRSTAPLIYPSHPLRMKTPPPLITSLPTDLMPPTQTGKTEYSR